MAYVLPTSTDDENKQGGQQDLTKGQGTGDTQNVQGSGQGASSGQAPNPQQFTQSKYSGAQAILDRNRGVTDSGVGSGILQGYQQQADAKKSALDSSAADYATAQKTPAAGAVTQDNYNDVLNNAITGNDPNSFGSLKTYLAGSAPMVQAFNPGVTGNLDMSAAKNNNVTQNLLTTKGGDYGSGDAALDNYLFNANGEGAKLAQGSGAIQTGLTDYLAGKTGTPAQNGQVATPGSVQTGVQNDVTANDASLRQNITNALTTRETGLESEWNPLLAQMNATRGADLTSATNAAGDELKASGIAPYETKIQDLLKNLSTYGTPDQYDPQGTVQALKLAEQRMQGIDPGQFVSSAPVTNAQYSDVAQNDEFPQYQRIMQLINGTDPAAGPGYSQGPVTSSSANYDKALQAQFNDPYAAGESLLNSLNQKANTPTQPSKPPSQEGPTTAPTPSIGGLVNSLSDGGGGLTNNQDLNSGKVGPGTTGTLPGTVATNNNQAGPTLGGDVNGALQPVYKIGDKLANTFGWGAGPTAPPTIPTDLLGKGAEQAIGNAVITPKTDLPIKIDMSNMNVTPQQAAAYAQQHPEIANAAPGNGIFQTLSQSTAYNQPPAAPAAVDPNAALIAQWKSIGLDQSNPTLFRILTGT